MELKYIRGRRVRGDSAYDLPLTNKLIWWRWFYGGWEFPEPYEHLMGFKFPYLSLILLTYVCSAKEVRCWKPVCCMRSVAVGCPSVSLKLVAVHRWFAGGRLLLSDIWLLQLCGVRCSADCCPLVARSVCGCPNLWIKFASDQVNLTSNSLKKNVFHLISSHF